MHTDELIRSLSRDLQPVSPNALPYALGKALLQGAIGTAVLFALFYGVRHDLSALWRDWPTLMKLTYALSVGLCAWLVNEPLARPTGRVSALRWLPLLPITLLAGVALNTAYHAPAELRQQLWLGHSALICPLNIGLLSLPVFALLIRALRTMAPTQLRLTGAMAGLTAGAIATLFYSLYCSETSVQFVATWYTLGMLLPAGYGALFGVRLLRW